MGFKFNDVDLDHNISNTDLYNMYHSDANPGCSIKVCAMAAISFGKFLNLKLICSRCR